MEYKTPMIAEMMGVSPKVVKRIVSQLNIEVKRNRFGHFIFDEEDVQNIRMQYAAEQETAATVAAAVQEDVTPAADTEYARQLEELQVQLDSLHHAPPAIDVTQFVPLAHFQALEAQVRALQAKTTETHTAPTLPITERSTLHKQLEALTQRVAQNETHMLSKADDIVNYQLLQHRREMEEMQQRIQALEETITRLESRKQTISPAIDTTYTPKPKRRNIIFSFFGL